MLNERERSDLHDSVSLLAGEVKEARGVSPRKKVRHDLLKSSHGGSYIFNRFESFCDNSNFNNEDLTPDIACALDHVVHDGLKKLGIQHAHTEEDLVDIEFEKV